MKSPQCIIADDADDIPLPSILKSHPEQVNLAGSSRSRTKRRKVTVKSKECQQTTENEGYPTDSTAASWLAVMELDSSTEKTGERNLGAPIVVDALSNSLSSLKIPEMLMQQNSPDLRKEPLYNEDNDANIFHHTGLEDTHHSVKLQKEGKHKMQKVTGRKTCSDTESYVTEAKCTMDPVTDDSRSTDYCTFSQYHGGVNPKGNECNKTGSESERRASITQLKKKSPRCVDNEDSPRFYSFRNKVVVILSRDECFSFTGKILLRVIYGAVEAYGSLVTPFDFPLEMYSPRGYSNIVVKARIEAVGRATREIWSALDDEGIRREPKNKLTDDIEHLQPYSTILVLTRLETKLTKFLRTFYPMKLFPKIKGPSHFFWTDPKRAEITLQSNLYFGSCMWKELVFDNCIADVAENILARWRCKMWSCVLVAGGKSVGKSTSVRYLINKLISSSGKVVLLDLDPGQAECTPAGCISYSLIDEPLAGPNFTHLKNPVYQLYIGDVNVSRCITRYIEGIKMLVEKLVSCPFLSRLPVVVNTMGFSLGIGWDIILFSIKLIRPTIVLQITSDRPRNNYPDYLTKDVVNRQQLSWPTWSENIVNWDSPCEHDCHAIRTQAERRSAPGTEQWNMEPYQQRELVMISYLAGIIRDTERTNSNDQRAIESLGINDARPYATPVASLSIAIPRTSVPPSRALSVVNGSIVALCGIDRTTEEDSEDAQISGPRFLTRLPLSTCYGFGIVRGVDMEKKEIFINSPLPEPIMQHVNCLVGCIPVPISLLQLNRFKNVPYTGGNEFVLPTSREPRRGYFRMRRQNPPEGWD